MPSRLALDIETISPRLEPNEYPDFEDPDDFELFAVALQYQDAGRPPERPRVLFRDSLSPRAERDLIERVADRVLYHRPDEIVTYNGDDFDHWLLRERPFRAGETPDAERVSDAIERALGSAESVDLIDDAWERCGEYTTLEAACRSAGLEPAVTSYEEYDHGLPESVRRHLDGDALEGAHVPVIGEAYLAALDGHRDDIDTDAVRRMIRAYAVGDIEHLFSLADRYGRGALSG